MPFETTFITPGVLPLWLDVGAVALGALFGLSKIMSDSQKLVQLHYVFCSEVWQFGAAGKHHTQIISSQIPGSSANPKAFRNRIAA